MMNKKSKCESKIKELEKSPKLIFDSYPDVCRQRYKKMQLKYAQQFQSELNSLEKMQPNAHEAMRFHRIFAIATLWPPLHTRKEIEWTVRYFQDPFDKKERRRLENILSERKYTWLTGFN